MVDKSVDLITISENNNLVLHNSILENLFQNIECPIAILTVINDSENFDPLFLDLILRYFALNGKQDWDKSHYKWNSDSTQDITPGIKIWSKPLRLFEIYGNNYKNKEINVIVMENNISAEVSEEIKHKLISFSINISSNIIYNTNKDLIRSSLISLGNSLKYTNYIKDIKCSFFFLVSDWNRKKYMNGFEGGKNYYRNIIVEPKLNEINKKLEKYFGEINCFLMLSYKRSSQHLNLGLTRYISIIIERYLEIDQITPTKLNVFQLLEKNRIFIDSFESRREDDKTNQENVYIDLNSEQYQAIEKAKLFYVQAMDKHFVRPKYIFAQELQELHEKYKSLSYNELNNELSQKTINTRVEEQFNNSIETIYDKYKRQNLTNIPIKPAIGIDLGTTYSCVGVMNRGEVHIIQNTYGLKTTPSCIAFKSNGEVMVGMTAKEQSYEDPSNTIYDVKRMIGRDYNSPHIQVDKKFWPFKVIEEKNSLKIKLRNDDNITLYPEQLSAKILLKLKKEAENFLNHKVSNAVITVPAYFNDAQRQATKDAGILAGLNVLQILNEPTAAAIAYSHQIRDDFSKNVLIYDLGGGTFDVAVVVIENETIDVRAVGGDSHLGGVDFDQRVLDFLFKKFENKFTEAIDEKKMKRALSRLRIYCENKKWELSERNSTVISIDELLPGWDFKFELTRNVFEDLCIDLFKKTIKIIEETLKCAQITANDIKEIVLIGGSTKIPKIQSLLREYFIDKPLNRQINPDEAVAYGATIQAALLNGEKFSNSNIPLISDVSPFSLGIEVLDKSMAIIIPRNTKIPTEKTRTFQTTEKNQTFVKIQIFEGEDKTAKNNRLLGEFKIDGLPKKRAGKVTVNVTIKIDKEGILHIKGVTSKESIDLTVKDHRGRLPPEMLKMLVTKVYKEK